MAAEPGALAVSGIGPTPPTSFPWTRCAETVSQSGPYCCNAACSSLLSPWALQRAQEVLTNHYQQTPRTPRPRQALRRVLSILGLNPLPAHTVPRAKRLPQPGPGHKRSHRLPGKTDTVLFVPPRLQSLSDRNKTSDRDRRLASDCCGGAAILQGEQIKTTRRPPSGPVTPLPGACPGELKHMSIQPSIHTCSQQHNSQQQKVVASPCVKWKINT